MRKSEGRAGCVASGICVLHLELLFPPQRRKLYSLRLSYFTFSFPNVSEPLFFLFFFPQILQKKFLGIFSITPSHSCTLLPVCPQSLCAVVSFFFFEDYFEFWKTSSS
uniref:Uncharacterized protein n=1 Tax=Trypanosoma congolense (strain IL3000) TaxID=1068625 RepID=G0UPS4_TRYCI|nr:hypothetical protein, unlikely [Trypanosoma congolense IL3000]